MYFAFSLSASCGSPALLRASVIYPQLVPPYCSHLLNTSRRQSVESGYMMLSTSPRGSALPMSLHFSSTPLSSSITNSRSDSLNRPKAKWRYTNCYNNNSNNMNGIHDNTKLSMSHIMKTQDVKFLWSCYRTNVGICHNWVTYIKTTDIVKTLQQTYTRFLLLLLVCCGEWSHISVRVASTFTFTQYTSVGTSFDCSDKILLVWFVPLPSTDDGPCTY